METKTFRKGDVIIGKGSHETCAYVIKSGRVEVSDLIVIVLPAVDSINTSETVLDVEPTDITL